MVIKIRNIIALDFNFNQCRGSEKHYRVFDQFTFVFCKKDDIYFVSILSENIFDSAFSITLSNSDLSILEQEVDTFITFLSYL